MAGKRILLVEGVDDEHVIKHLCGNRGGPQLDVNRYDGVDRLLDGFPVRLKASEGGEIVGMVIDADTNVAARWASLRNRLLKLGYDTVPNDPAPDGTVLEPPSGTLLPRVGIWMMPDNRNKGILEDFLRFLIPEGSRLFEHVKSSVANIPEGEVRFGELDEPKALLHTWLAWQKEPGKPLGIAITARCLDPDVPEVDVFVSWLNRLFSP